MAGAAEQDIIMIQSNLDDTYGPFRLVRSLHRRRISRLALEILRVGGMTKCEAIELAAEIPGCWIEQQDPHTKIWSRW